MVKMFVSILIGSLIVAGGLMGFASNSKQQTVDQQQYCIDNGWQYNAADDSCKM